MAVTEFGMVIDVKAAHPQKAFQSISVTETGIEIEDKLEQQ